MSLKKEVSVPDEVLKKYGEVCVYCLELKTSHTCCKENHFENAYEDSNGNLVLESDIRDWMTTEETA